MRQLVRVQIPPAADKRGGIPKGLPRCYIGAEGINKKVRDGETREEWSNCKRKMEKKVEILKSEPCEITFAIKLPEEEVKRGTEEVYQSLQSRVVVQGFRRGKVPLEIVKQRFLHQAREEIIKNLISQTLNQVIAERKLKSLFPARIKNLNFKFEEPFTFELTLETKPEFEPQGYTKISLEKKIKKVTQEDVEKTINSLQERNAYLVESNDTVVKKEHYIVVDYEMFLDTTSTPVSSLKNQLLNLSATNLIPGFVEQILGMNKSEAKEIKVTLPKNYPKKELAEKEVIIRIKVYTLKEKKLPGVNDDFARDLGFSSLEELNIKIKENLEKLEEKNAQTDLENQIIEHLLKHNPIPLPPSLVEGELEFLLEQMRKFFENLPGEEWEKNLPELKKKYRPEAEKRVGIGLILSAIAEKEKIEQKEEKIFDFLIKNGKIKNVTTEAQR